MRWRAVNQHAFSFYLVCHNIYLIRFFSRNIQPFFISCINWFSTSCYLAIVFSSPPALSGKTPHRNAQTLCTLFPLNFFNHLLQALRKKVFL
ncbi:hypothetical protein ID10_16015 [Pantoea agglomerans]|nr:hypothetical protein ID10_16015 [Pantoea agglomerans]